MLGFELIQLFISIFFSSLVFKFLYSQIQEFFVFKHSEKNMSLFHF